MLRWPPVATVFSIVVASLCAVTIAQAQSPLPRPGSYYCYTTTAGTAARGPYATAVLPAFFGKLIFDANSSYRFSGRAGGGRVTLNRAAKELAFTGDMHSMRGRDYSAEEDNFTLGSETFSFLCTLEGRTASAAGAGARSPTSTANGAAGSGATQSSATIPAAKPTNGAANGLLRGTLITTPSYRYNNFLGKVLAYDLQSGSTSTLFSDGVANANPKGEIVYVDSRSRMKITDRTGNQTLAQLREKAEFNFDDFYPALSPNGDYIAFVTPSRSSTGTIVDLAPGPGVTLIIARRNGDPVAQLKGLTQPSWMPNGGLVAAGDGDSKRGLWLVEPGFRNMRRLLDGYDVAMTPAVSADGRMVAFSKDGEIWSCTIDGARPTKLAFGSGVDARFPAWSPDGRFLAFAVTYMPQHSVQQHHMMIQDIAADTAFWPADHGNRVPAQNRIVWLP
jgi:WD40-like Beta Propeller Repeat